jgi:hypothetical protein
MKYELVQISSDRSYKRDIIEIPEIKVNESLEKNRRTEIDWLIENEIVEIGENTNWLSFAPVDMTQYQVMKVKDHKYLVQVINNSLNYFKLDYENFNEVLLDHKIKYNYENVKQLMEGIV